MQKYLQGIHKSFLIARGENIEDNIIRKVNVFGGDVLFTEKINRLKL